MSQSSEGKTGDGSDGFHIGILYHQPITALLVFMNLKVSESDSKQLKLEYISPKVNIRSVSKARVNKKFDGNLLESSPAYAVLGVERKETSLGSSYVRGTNIFSSQTRSDSPLFDFEIEKDDLEKFYFVTIMNDSVENITDETQRTYVEESNTYFTTKVEKSWAANRKFFRLLQTFFKKYEYLKTREDFRKLLSNVKAVEKLLDMKYEVIFLILLNLMFVVFLRNITFLVVLCYIDRSVSMKACLAPSLLNFKRF